MTNSFTCIRKKLHALPSQRKDTSPQRDTPFERTCPFDGACPARGPDRVQPPVLCKYNSRLISNEIDMTRSITTLFTLIAALLAATSASAGSDTLAEILAAQPDEVQARYEHRHPQETLEFFGIEPGMTVVEVLPGGGWYTKILLPYLGVDGKLIGADYAIENWAAVYNNEEFLANRAGWAAEWTERASGWAAEDGASIDAFVLGALPESMHGTADAFLFVRAMHNMNRSGEDSVHLKVGIQNAWDALKPGGIVGIVQHHARDEMSDEWAGGSNGYLKRGLVVGFMQAAGFELAGETDINANENDRPTESEVVWRLPPNYGGTDQDDAEGRAALDAIGESNRMTLKFVKP